jgi:CRISPR-associated protein (TIGR02584 family)
VSADEPSNYRRRVLLCVVGLTPQVITETLYALAVLRAPPFIPNDIRVVTTSEGSQRALLTLLDPDSGALPQLSKDYALEGLATALTPERIHTINDGTGAALGDISSDKDSRFAADTLTRMVQRLTADPAAALHVSIAGGRKPMGFFAGYALSLFGRCQDRLSHVLVSPEFEAHPQFFYPPPKPRVLLTRDNRPVRTDAARIILADIPFVRLRHGLPRSLLAGEASYARAVAGVQGNLGPPELVLDADRRQMTAGGTRIALSAVLFAWIVWLAGRRKRGDPNEGAVHWIEANVEEFLEIYGKVAGASAPQVERARGSLAKGMTREYFEEKKARYNKLVRDALGVAAEPYCIRAIGRRPRTRFGLRLPADAIRFVGHRDVVR